MFSSQYGTTPLVWACRKGYTEIVPLLLEAGANVDTAGMVKYYFIDLIFIIIFTLLINLTIHFVSYK